MTNTYFKAAIAFAAALAGAATAGANGVDVSHLDIGQWLSVLGTGLVAGGALLHDPKGKEAENVEEILDRAVAAKEELTKKALGSIADARGALDALVKALPADVQPTATELSRTAAEAALAVVHDADALAQQVIDKVNG